MGEASLKGKAIRIGDAVSTDDIIPGRFSHLRSDLPELAKHGLEDALPDFRARVEPGDLLVGGWNFGLGSSREHAPVVLKMSGLGAILAKSFARIFFRNAINQGLPVLMCDTDGIRDGDELEVDLGEGEVRNKSTGAVLECSKIPPLMSEILAEGGLMAYVKKHGDLPTGEQGGQ
ncbi:MAG: 3-isopropylmalate dehydratase small subunit [Chloroflexota bacterium]